jgi:DNA topoisomerase-1
MKGQCGECGTTLFRFGATALHEGMTAPPPAPKAEKAAKPKKVENKGKTTGKTKKKTATGKTKPARSGKKSTTPATKVRRNRKLVIVESPAKARTIGKYLGNGYDVLASLGHVRDLLKSRLSVEVEQNFEPTYRVPNEKKELVKEISTAAKAAGEIFLATDPDREGEAIAWHLMEAAEMPQNRVQRVVFHEITPKAIKESFEHPRPIDMQLVEAQQARRILDRLVGFNLSPLLWKKVRGRLSAGRVQSVALRMVVEREREIREFNPQEYWTIRLLVATEKSRKNKPRPQFEVRLVKVAGEDPALPDETTTKRHLQRLEQVELVISDIRQSERRRRPSAPFTTSTLQQEASRRLGFGTSRTMALAQQLYEGVDLGDGNPVGLITYMRTDSVTVSQEATDEARGYIRDTYGKEYVPAEVPTYKTRAKKAQEAHEAIRPTSALRTPESVKKHLEGAQLKLYTLIWQRFVASQMENALEDRTTVDVTANPKGEKVSDPAAYLFRATGTILRFPGFLALYEESKDEDAAESEDTLLPALNTGEGLDALEQRPNQHFTQPPPRFTEATLVRALEENGIGRPSTYAPIVNTLTARGYTERENKRLIPTELGEVVTDALVEYFPDVLDVGFTAQMEQELDEIAEGDRKWVKVLGDFYAPFSERLDYAQESMDKIEVGEELAGVTCEKCGREMVLRMGRYGKFIACPGFPECRNTLPYLEYIGVKCKQCGDGDIIEKRTKGGRIFYGCSNFPECDFSSWKKPIATPCPTCSGMLVEENKTQLRCLQCDSRFARGEVLPQTGEDVEYEEIGMEV